MLNTSSMTLPRKLTTTQKAARGVIFQCLQKMEIGCLTVIESFKTETTERSERFSAPNGGVQWSTCCRYYRGKTSRLLFTDLAGRQYCCW